MPVGRVVGVLLLGLVSACGSEGPEAAIRALIEGAEEAAESRETGFFRDILSESYVDARGNDRDRLISTLRGFFLTHDSIEIVTRIESIELSGSDAATATLHVGMLGSRAGASLIGGLDGELYRVELELVERGGDWQVIGARWERTLE